MFAGVVQQVDENLAQVVAIGLGAQPIGHVNRECVRRHDGRVLLGGLAQQRAQIGGLQRWFGLGIQCAQREQIVGQADHPREFHIQMAQHPVRFCGVILGRAHAQQLHRPAERGEWRAQLMGGIGHKTFLRGEGILNLSDHAIKRAAQLPNLIRPRKAHPLGQVARGDGQAGVHHFLQRVQGPARGEHAQRSGGGQHKRNPHPQTQGQPVQRFFKGGGANAHLNRHICIFGAARAGSQN